MEFDIISPIDGQIIDRIPYHNEKDIENTLNSAKDSQRIWARVSLNERLGLARAFLDKIEQEKDAFARDITLQMGRPISQSPGEINGVLERGRYMISVAEKALSDVVIENSDTAHRFMKKQPLGLVFVIAPWNYPLLTAINSILPAIIAGNSVILKHAKQTTRSGKKLVECAKAIGLPEGIFQMLCLTHDATKSIIESNSVDHVVFTGSTQAGHSIYQSVATHFNTCGLELGGKDAAYVCQDADLDMALDNIVDGVYFNSGQSCCGIERIYVHDNLYDDFISGFKTRTEQYRLGNPLESDTNLGPMVSVGARNIVDQHIEDACLNGASTLIDNTLFTAAKADTAYVAPQALIDVDHSMRVMTEENFGPLVGIMKVTSEQQALELINDSDFGLSASLWSKDPERATLLAPQIQVGTVFMNRCDYLDPSLAWTGVKETGHGVSLSQFGYDSLTRLQSFHFKK